MNTQRSTQEKGFRLTVPNGIADSGSKLDSDSLHSDFPSFKSRLSLRHRGFTLLELMIVVGLVAILAVFALPAYNEYVVRTKLRAGTEGLAAFRSVLEQAYQDARSYRTDDDSACRVASYASDYFTLTCTASDDRNYILTAAAQAGVGLGNAGDFTYTINQDGTVKTTKYKGSVVDVDHWKYK